MAGIIFLIFSVIVIAACIRWGLKSFFGNRNRAANTAPGVIRRTPTRPSEAERSEAQGSARSAERSPSEDRRTTVYTITADPRGNDPANDFTDFFWDGLPHASSSQNEPAKDDKDLPTYEEVMQLEMAQQAIRPTTVTPANNNTTTTTSVVVPVIPVTAASTI